MTTIICLGTIISYAHKRNYNIIDHSPYAEYYILVAYFITQGGYSLIPFTCFLHSLPHSPLAPIHLFSVLMSVFVVLLVVCVCV